MKIEFKRATLDDVDAINEVHNLSFYADYVKYGVCPGYNHSKECMTRILMNTYDFEILCDSNLVGNMIVLAKENGEYHLGGLCVIPEYENRGIGQQSIRFIEQEFPDAKIWTLDTPADKYRNHYFYEKMGFVKTGESVDCTVALFNYTKQIKK